MVLLLAKSFETSEPICCNVRLASTVISWPGMDSLRNRRAALALLAAAVLSGCPSINSEPCQADADCGAGRRCRLGACAPECRDDVDCPAGQACTAEGRCAEPPQCMKAADCASGFTCAEGKCLCLRDAACAAGEACLSGACGPMPACAQDADCAAYGRTCEPNQGICLVACTTLADCPAGTYCTAQQGGVCAPYETCGSTAECDAAFECRPFSPCPPGFDCAQLVC